MKAFIRIGLIFSIPILTYCIIAMFTLPSLLAIQNGPSTKEQITSSFNNAIIRNYRLMILGSSKTYRGLNPEYFDIDAFNFSHDNDSYNQMFYKLEYLLSNKIFFKHLIISVDYHQFSYISDTRNYIYGELLSENYLKDFNTSLFKYKLDYYLSNSDPKLFRSVFSQVQRPILRDNGQYIKFAVANENDSISRKIRRLEFQVKYFIKLLDKCRSKNIKVFMVMLPARTNELKNRTMEETKEFNAFIESFTDNKNTFYLNYSRHTGFNTTDYTDITHLNEDAANRFSKLLNDTLIKYIGHQNDF